MKYGVQMYTLRDFLKDEKGVDAIFSWLSSIGMPAVELAAMPKIDAEQLRALAVRSGVAIASSHNSLFDLQWKQEKLIRAHKIYGAAYIGIGGMPFKYRKSKRAVLKFISKFNRLADQYAQAGLKLIYHNHDFEFAALGDTTIFELMCAQFNNNVGFCLDCYWAYYAGQDVEACISRLGQRLELMHFKGCRVENGKCAIAPLGDGVLDFGRYLQLGSTYGAAYALIELDESEAPKADIETSFAYLNNLEDVALC